MTAAKKGTFRNTSEKYNVSLEYKCLLFHILPFHILKMMVSNYFSVNDVSRMDVALCNSKLRHFWEDLVLRDINLETLSQYKPSYVKFSFLKCRFEF